MGKFTFWGTHKILSKNIVQRGHETKRRNPDWFKSMSRAG